MRRFFLAVVLAVALTPFVACSADPEPDVAFVVARADDLPTLAYATSGVRAVGFATTDAAMQRAYVERALAMGVRVIVLEPQGDATAILHRAHDRGVRVVAYGSEPRAQDRADTFDALVAFDGYRAGALQAAAAIDAIGHGRIAILHDRAATGVAAEVARGYTLTLAPYIARREITVVDDLATADAALATDGASVRTLSARPAFVASVDGSNVDLVCAGRQQLDVRFDRADLASAAATVVRRLLAGDDLRADPQTSRLPNRRLPVELAPVRVFTADDCVATR